MAIDEVFQNPTVKSVHFEIRFPNLFYIEQRIGDLQTRIMDKFPESKLVLRRQVVFGDIGPEGKIELPHSDGDAGATTKVWTFASGEGVEVNVLNNALRLHSSHHKTYNSPQSTEKFRDMIAYVLKQFFEVASIPLIARLGLRYIDECPIPAKENKIFQKWYKTTFPLARFDIADATEMTFRTTVAKGGFFLRYIESLNCTKDVNSLTLDFDGYAEKVKPEDCLATTDALHDVISDEYEASIGPPVFGYMRKGEEAKK